MNEITCKVCGNKFTPFKSKKYEVVIPTTSFGIYCGQPMIIGEAFDCPMCGCQHIANTRYKALKEESESLTTKNPICKCCKEYESKVCDLCDASNNYEYYDPIDHGEGEE